MPKIYVYKVTADDGIAPCPQRGVLTLGVCKPAIRRKARPGDFLVGVGANTCYPGKLIYVAEVEISIPGERYYSPSGPYRHRFDCIYTHQGDTRYSWRNHGGRRVHYPKKMPTQKNRDVGFCRLRSNAVVLSSKRFVYFGQDTANFSEQIWDRFGDVYKRVERMQRNHLVEHPAEFEQRLLELCEYVLTHPWPNAPRVDGPHSPPSASTCHDNCRSVCSH